MDDFYEAIVESALRETRKILLKKHMEKEFDKLMKEFDSTRDFDSESEETKMENDSFKNVAIQLFNCAWEPDDEEEKNIFENGGTEEKIFLDPKELFQMNDFNYKELFQTEGSIACSKFEHEGCDVFVFRKKGKRHYIKSLPHKQLLPQELVELLHF